MGSAPASGAVAGASPATGERANQPHRLVCSDAFDPTGEGADRDTRGRVGSPNELNRSGLEEGAHLATPIWAREFIAC